MCGRYVLTTPVEALRDAFGFVEQPNLAPRYNIAPTQDVPVLRQRRQPEGERTLQMLRWGLVPPRARSLADGARMINARAETVATKPAFAIPFRRRRCLVPASGFYEWRPDDPSKQPYLIAQADGALFAFAGIWERWNRPADAAGADEKTYVDSFAIITTEANERLKPLHHRMPVILAPGDYPLWLDPMAEPDRLAGLLRPAANDLLDYRPIDRRANNVRNDDAALLRQLEALSA